MKTSVDHTKLLLPPTASVKRAIGVMTGPEGAGMVLVTDRARRLLGVVVDYDIRKAILKGLGLDAPISRVMNPDPVTMPDGMDREAIVRFFQAHLRASIPIVGGDRRVRGLAQMSEYLAQAAERTNAVVLMVGGAGKRLRPLTENRPKPLLPVGDRPLLQTIVEQFTAAGFKRFFLAVNHHAEQIKLHFGDGRRLGAEVRYLEEQKALGTAGALSLLPRTLREPLIVMNGDLLTKIDFKALLDFHAEEENVATLCVREYDFQVPYGVVQLEDHRLQGIVEKPTHHFFVNAGIYVLDPKVLSWLPRGRPSDMPAFLERIRRRRPRSVGCFPIREYWLDIGRIDEYKRAQAAYEKLF